MIPLKYNTASQEIPLGYFLDSTDGNTEETGLTIANTDIKLWKNGATTLANKNSGGGTHISNGVYYATLDATDTNTYGPMVVFVHVSGALAVRLECLVMNADAYDALYSDSSGKIRANVTEISGDSAAADNLESYCDGTTPIPANATQISGDATAADNLESACDGTGYNVGGGSVVAASVTGAVGSVTGNVGGNVTGSVGSVASGGITAASIATGAIDADAIAADAAAEIADAIWDEVLSGHTGAGSAGLALAGASAPSAADVADAVWDEAISGHLTAGTTGNALNAAGSAGDPWSTPLPGAYGAGTAGYIIGNNLNAPVGTVDTVVDNIYSRLGSPAGASMSADILAIDNLVDDLESRLTATRAGYLDNLSAGAVALASGVTVSDKTGFELSSTGIDGILDEVVESTLTLRQVLRLMLSVLAGKSSGGGTGTMAFRDIADSKDRISASVDDDGNRTAVTRDAT